MIAKVKWFNDGKGWGFIEQQNSKSDIFVHYSKIISDGKGRRTLANGEEVEFDVENTPKGLAAVNVKRKGVGT
jgi:cold shock protein